MRRSFSSGRYRHTLPKVHVEALGADPCGFGQNFPKVALAKCKAAKIGNRRLLATQPADSVGVLIHPKALLRSALRLRREGAAKIPCDSRTGPRRSPANPHGRSVPGGHNPSSALLRRLRDSETTHARRPRDVTHIVRRLPRGVVAVPGCLITDCPRGGGRDQTRPSTLARTPTCVTSDRRLALLRQHRKITASGSIRTAPSRQAGEACPDAGRRPGVGPAHRHMPRVELEHHSCVARVSR